MKPFYSVSTTNFGDYINSWLWKEIAPEIIDDDLDVRLVGVGSLIKKDLGLVRGRKVIVGTGSGYGSAPTREQVSTWDVACVRGPETARLMGLGADKVATDAAWLINRLDAFAGVPASKHGVLFIPHWTTHLRGNWAPASALAGLEYLDPFSDSKEILRRISRSSLVVTESLHGAIFADYYRTPWIAVCSPVGILPFKWHDWCSSVGVGYKPYLLPPSDYLDFWLQGRPRGSLPMELTRLNSSAADVRPLSSRPPAAVNLRYKAMVRVKGWGRTARKRAAEAIYPLRDSRALKGWNDRHRESLADLLTRLLDCEPSLSDDSVRNEKIDHLNDALDRVRRQYAVH